MSRIPTAVSRDDFLEALQPLLSMLQIGNGETADWLHYAHGRLTLNVAARKAGDDSDHPDGVALDESPQEDAQLYHQIVVEVRD